MTDNASATPRAAAPDAGADNALAHTSVDKRVDTRVDKRVDTRVDKRAMTRVYKEAGVTAGVYVLRNKVNQRALVGASMNLDGAMNRLRFELEQGGHRNRRLQQDWNQFGAANFSVDVADTVRPRDDPAFDATAELQDLFALWCDEVPCTGEAGYNVPPRQAR